MDSVMYHNDNLQRNDNFTEYVDQLATCKPKAEPTPTMVVDKFKTRLCTHFMKTGTCFYGTKCHYAHGMHELRRTTDSAPLIHPRHKTTLCQNQFMHGTCKYGSSCMFIHKEDHEFKGMQERMLNQAKLLESSNHPQSSKQNEQMRDSIPKLDISHLFAPDVQEESSTEKDIVGSLFTPLTNVANISTIQQPSNFTPGTPVSAHKSLSYDDRRSSAAMVWGALSPRVSVWEQRLRGGKRFLHCHTNMVTNNSLSTPPGF